MKHIILGAGPAGVIAAETIRKHAPYDEILIVGDEAEAPYSRMAIPYLLIDQERALHRGERCCQVADAR
jgi:NADPH-dependent 2,4-dienoyl-CoA reductase/sulfur reductase-like enzyme